MRNASEPELEASYRRSLANSLHHEPLELKGKDKPTESSLFILHFTFDTNAMKAGQLSCKWDFGPNSG